MISQLTKIDLKKFFSLKTEVERKRVFFYNSHAKGFEREQGI